MFKIYQENNHRVIKVLGAKLKIRNDEGIYFSYKQQEPEIKKYKYVHLMNNGLHSINILNFINKYFDKSEHCFIFPCIMFEATQKALKGYDNVYYCSIKNISLSHNEKIIVHGLFDNSLVSKLYENKHLLKRTYWFIWGGDLYSAPRDKKQNYVRGNVAGILTSFDKEIYEEKYGKVNSWFDVTYPHDITEEMLVCDENAEKDYVHVQVNNSADATTFEMLEILSKFADKPMKVTTILSYKTVGQKDSIIRLMKKGYEIFGKNFNPIIDFMPKEEYAKHLASVDIYISNQNRQQGNGNASTICSLGKKVFTKSDTTVYKKYNSLGIRYYDTYTIPDLTWEEFIAQDEEVTRVSVERLKERMKDETKVKQWRDFFLSK